MWVGLVVGNIVATRKDERLVGHKLMLVRRYDLTGAGKGEQYVVAVDRIGAGIGERVLCVSGSSARLGAGQPDGPIDAAIVGIIDTIELDRGLLGPVKSGDET